MEYFRWYGLFWALGIVSAYQVMLTFYKKEGLLQADLDRLTTYLIIGILVGARLGHILFYDPVYYWENPMEILPFRINPSFEFTGLAGLASHGGVLGAFLALFLYIKKYKISLLWALDRLAIAASLLGSFIRFGNLMNSEIIGVQSSVPWAFVFTRVDQVPRHPAQLYEALFYFLIFILLLFFKRSEVAQNHKGLLFGAGFTLIFVQRFLVEFFKEDQVAFEAGLILNMGQLLSIPLIIIGTIIFSRSLMRPSETDAEYDTSTLN